MAHFRNWRTCGFAHACEIDGATVIALHNLSDRFCVITLQEIQHQHLMEVFSDNFSLARHDQKYEPLDNNSNTVAINAYGYRWFRAANAFGSSVVSMLNF